MVNQKPKKTKKDRHYNGQKKKDKRAIIYKTTLYRKIKIKDRATRTLLKNQEWWKHIQRIDENNTVQ
jgi:hypothetical protein